MQRTSKLKNLDNRLRQLFDKYLYSYISLNDFKSSNTTANKYYKSRTYSYQKYYSELEPWMKLHSRAAGMYIQGLKLQETLTAHSNELMELVEELEKKI